MILACRLGVPGSNPVRIQYFCHAFIHFFVVTDFVRKMGARSGLAKEPYNVQKWTFCQIGFPSSINDDFKWGSGVCYGRQLPQAWLLPTDLNTIPINHGKENSL